MRLFDVNLAACDDIQKSVLVQLSGRNVPERATDVWQKHPKSLLRVPGEDDCVAGERVIIVPGWIFVKCLVDVGSVRCFNNNKNLGVRKDLVRDEILVMA
jgi:hypothetical protein